MIRCKHFSSRVKLCAKKRKNAKLKREEATKKKENRFKLFRVITGQREHDKKKWKRR